MYFRILLVCIVCIHSANTSAQVSNQEEEAINLFIAENTSIEADAINSKSLVQISNAQFFKVTRTKNYCGGSSNQYLLLKQENTLLELKDPNSLVAYIRPEYKLKSQESAEFLQKALSILFEYGTIRQQEIIEKENQWILVQGEWFDDKTGFIVNTDNKGRVLEIEYSEKLEL